MFRHCPRCARIRAALSLVALLILYSACAPVAATEAPATEAPATEAPATEAPASPSISPDNMVFPAEVAANEKQQVIQAFLDVSPNVHSSLAQAVKNQHAKNASSVEEPALNFAASNAVYIRDQNQALQLQVIGVPVQWMGENVTKIETMLAAGATEDLILGTMHVENNIESGPQKGDYLAIWQAASNTVVMQDVVNGLIAQESQVCEANLNPGFDPAFEFSEGSFGICIPWDDRRCCF